MDLPKFDLETYFEGPASGAFHTGSGSLQIEQMNFYYGEGRLAVPLGAPESLIFKVPSTPGFVGREAWLAQTMEWIKEIRLITLLGPVGIGKSWCLSRLAQQLEAQGTNVFWHTFTPFTSFGELLSRLAAFVDRRQNRSLYLALLQSQYSLSQKLDLLIDGLNTFEPVFCFDDYHRAGSNSEIDNLISYLIEKLEHGSVLVTSRQRPPFCSVDQRLAGQGIEVHLEGLSAEEARQFFELRQREVPESLCEFIADEFGGLPRALDLVEKLLDIGYDQKVLTDHLGTHIGQPILQYLYEELWRYLDDGAKEILKIGALLVLPFPASRMCRLCECGRVREHLAKLEEQSLLHEFAAEWYVEHEAVQSLALSFCDDVTTLRATIAARLTEPRPESAEDVLEAAIQFFFTQEYNRAARLISEELIHVQVPSHYQGAIDALLEGLDQEKYRQGQIGQEEWLWLCNARGHYLSECRAWDQAESEYRSMLRLAQTCDDKAAVSVALQNIGVVFQLGAPCRSSRQAQEHRKLAEQYYRNSLAIKKEIGDTWGQAQIHGNLGNMYLDREEHVLAQREFESQMELLVQDEADQWYFLSTYANRGRLLAEQGQYEEAIASYRQALAIAEEYDSPADIAKLNYNLGHAYQDMGDVQKALELCEKAHQLACEANFLEIQDRAAVALGKCYHTLEQYDKSIEYFEAVGEIRSELQDFAGLAAIYFDISTFHYLRGNVEQARDYAVRGLELFDHLTSESQIDLFVYNAYQMFREADMLEQARQQFKSLRRRILSRQDYSTYALIKVYEVLGQIYLELSKGSVADWCFARSSELVDQNRDSEELAEHLGWIGSLFEEAEKYVLSLHWYQRAIQTAGKEGLKVLEAGIRYNIGNVYANLERWEDAEENYDAALRLARETGNVEIEELSLHNIGYIARQRRDFDKAAALLRRSVELSKQLEDLDGQATALNNLGLTYQDAGQHKQAEACLQESLALHRASGAKSQEANVLISLGNYYSDLEQFGEAESCYRESLSIARETENWEMEEKVVLALGYLYWRKGEFARIEKLYKETIDKMNELRRYAPLAEFAALAGRVAADEGKWDIAANNYLQGFLASFYVGGERIVENVGLSSPSYLREFRNVWVEILRAFQDLLENGRRDEAKELCEHLVKIIDKDERLSELTQDSFRPYFEKLRDYLRANNDQPFEDFLELLFV